MKNSHGVDLDQVVENASAEGIALSQITLFYEGLTAEELSKLMDNQLFAKQTDKCVIGRFNSRGVALFPDKITGVYSLSS